MSDSEFAVGKRLLVLGGTSASLEIVQEAHKMGVYVIVADDQQTGAAKEIADESVVVSTTDIEKLSKLIKEKKIDGVFCGPSEFNIINTMNLCMAAGLPFYATKEQWDICSNKARFKELCRQYKVPCVLEFNINDLSEDIDFPVILKPVDGCSSKGITVCHSRDELDSAYKFALEYSNSKEALIEKYIENRGEGFSVRYIVDEGDLYLSLMGDRYVTDPYDNTALTTNLVIYPSRYTKKYQEEIDANVKKMFQSIGLKNGVLFMQALPEKGNIYFHEMGLRLSGGLTYVITEAANNINDVQMMIRYAVGGKMCTDEEKRRIDPLLHGKTAVLFSVPIKPGTIGVFDGADQIQKEIEVSSYTQYYYPQDTIPDSYVGTTSQFCCRFKFFADSREDAAKKIHYIQDMLNIRDINGEDMIYRYFDTERIFA